MGQIKLSDIVLDDFKDFWKASKNNDYLYYILKGGRSSAKSSHISLRGIIEIIQKPVNGLVVRKHAKYLRESVFEQLKWAANELGVAHLFKFQVSPMQIVYKPRGSKIFFAGADDPQRIKSIASSEYPYTWLWIEELAEFKSEDEVETIEDSIIREETDQDYKIFYSYNPPKRKSNWCNKKFNSVTLPDMYFVHHSDYRDNPYISEQTLQKINYLKENDEHKYRHTWLGEPIGSGVVPFSNLEFRTITEEELSRFDNIRQGIDWGYAADPFCFLRIHLDKKRKKLYIIDELMEIQLSNRKAADWIIDKGYNDVQITADSEEPKSIDEMGRYEIRIKGAIKGPGSVEYGEKWLNDLNAIIIDPDRTPKTAKEYENIDYATDKDGNIKNRLEDENNHSIDTTRYACEDDMSTGGVSFDF
jgi:PBSX family phage terminase large subunit